MPIGEHHLHHCHQHFSYPYDIVWCYFQSTSSTWREVFYISAEIYIFGVILFSVLGSGEVQSWAKDSQLYETLPEDTTGSEDDNSSPKSDSSINRSQDKKSDT